MKNNRKIATGSKFLGVSIALGVLIFSGSAAQARYDYNNWQPALGTTHSIEDSLEARMNDDYTRGYIDTNELAQLRRDLDGIQAQEDEFRVDHNGLGRQDRKCLSNKLKRFEQNLSRAESDKFEFTIAACNQ